MNDSGFREGKFCIVSPEFPGLLYGYKFNRYGVTGFLIKGSFMDDQMQEYQKTEEDERMIAKLQSFGSLVKRWMNPSLSDAKDKIRSEINRNIEDVAEIVRLAGCRKIYSMMLPPEAGVEGYIIRNIDPFKSMFEKILGRSLNSEVLDMLDHTISVIQTGKFQEQEMHLEQ
ncbi:MAG: hypothetical protein HQL89_09075 [Magnetococcales bacterium]|nr:hypothetical protein [Magnetococcales bacterium]